MKLLGSFYSVGLIRALMISLGLFYSVVKVGKKRFEGRVSYDDRFRESGVCAMLSPRTNQSIF